MSTSGQTVILKRLVGFGPNDYHVFLGDDMIGGVCKLGNPTRWNYWVVWVEGVTRVLPMPSNGYSTREEAVEALLKTVAPPARKPPARATTADGKEPPDEDQ